MSSYHNVPVPEERLPEVFALLARPATKQAPLTQINGSQEFSKDAIERMVKESPDRMKAFLHHLAENAGQEFSTEEMSEVIGCTTEQLAGVLGAFGRRAKNRYRWTKWPFIGYRDHTRHALVYRMTPEVAELVLEVKE